MPSQAQTVRKYSNEFLKNGVGARSYGMSYSVTSFVDDVSAGYWNPAGLTQLNNRFQTELMHAEYFAGIAAYDYGSFAMPLDNGDYMGVTIIRLGVDDIQNTIDLVDQDGNVNYDRITKFSTADYAGIFSYARKTKIEGLSIGGNAKIIYRMIGDFASAWGFGLDAGAQYRLNEKWFFGASAKDVTTTFNVWSYSLDSKTKEVFLETDNEIPENGLELTAPQLTLGVARKFWVKDVVSILPAFDFNMTFEGQRNTLVQSKAFNLDPTFGLETSYKEFIYLRGGIGNITTVKDEYTFQPNFGVGIYLKNLFGLGSLAIDYALTDLGDQSGTLYSNIFSLRFEYNGKQ
ncbi:MAG: hypothetical protein CL843_02070 [Crocinitomicaceae bacterium]|nr:hypothetical protein [Crocinitomicaceae bacterium]